MRLRLTSAAALLATITLAACDAPQSLDGPSRATLLADVRAGNSAAAHACQQGGWQNLAGSDGTLFTNEGECVRYAAHGGTLGPRIPPTITSFTFGFACLPNQQGSPEAFFTAVFTGGTGTVTTPAGAVLPIQSGVQIDAGVTMFGTYTLTVSNGSASVTATLIPFDGGGTPSCGNPGVIVVAPGHRGRAP